MKFFYFGAVSFFFVQTIKAQSPVSDSLQLDQVVVVASKFGESRSKLPYQVTRISQKDLIFTGSPNTAEALAKSGQVFSQKSQGGGGSPVLRGFEANRIQLVMDGVRMNNAIYRGGHLQNVLRTDQSVLSDIEVLFGPASVLYGSDAMGGVVNFRTSEPELFSPESSRLKVAAFSRYASGSNEYTQHVAANLGFKKIASLTGVTYSDFGDIRQGHNRSSDYPDFGKKSFFVTRKEGRDIVELNKKENVQVGSGYKQLDILQKLTCRQSAKVSHGLNFQLSTSGNVNRYDRLTQGTVEKPGYSEWYYGPEKRMLLAYKLHLTGNEGRDQLNLTTAYQKLEESRNTRKFNNKNLISQIEDVTGLSINVDARKSLKSHVLHVGAEAIVNGVRSTAQAKDIEQQTISPAATRYPDGRNRMYWLAAYATDRWAVGDKLVLNAGLRYSYVGLVARFMDKTYFPFPYDEVVQRNGSLTGQLGLVWSAAAATKVRVVTGTGFRAPNIDDVGKVFESAPGTLIVPNPDLKPEYLTNIEISVEQDVTDKLSFEFRVFHSWLKNAITVSPGTFEGKTQITYQGVLSQVLSTQNKQRAAVQGANVTLRFRPMPSVLVSSVLNYTHGRILIANDKSPLDHIPPLFGCTSVEYQHKSVRLAVFSEYSGWKRIKDYRLGTEDNELYAAPEGMPSWWTINFASSIRLPRQLSFQLAFENILDRNYRVFASGISAVGRNVKVTLRKSF